MSAAAKRKPIPIYTTRGDWAALLVFPYIFSTVGEWIGFVTKDREVFDTDGVYVGWVTAEPRILRRRIMDEELKRTDIPAFPSKIAPPATVPLPPMMSELPFEIIDVFEEEPDRLHTSDTGEFKPDLE